MVPESKQLQLFLENIEIPFKDNIKYLGVTFNKLLKFNDHGRILLAKVKRISGMFSALLNSRHLPKNTKLLIYKVAIRSVLIYAFPIWFTVSPSVAKKLEIFERSVLRKCINKNFASYTKRHSNAVIYEDSAVTPLCTYALALERKFAEKLGTHDNSYVFDHEKDADWSSL